MIPVRTLLPARVRLVASVVSISSVLFARVANAQGDTTVSQLEPIVVTNVPEAVPTGPNARLTINARVNHRIAIFNGRVPSPTSLPIEACVTPCQLVLPAGTYTLVAPHGRSQRLVRTIVLGQMGRDVTVLTPYAHRDASWMVASYGGPFTMLFGALSAVIGFALGTDGMGPSWRHDLAFGIAIAGVAHVAIGFGVILLGRRLRQRSENEWMVRPRREFPSLRLAPRE